MKHWQTMSLIGGAALLALALVGLAAPGPSRAQASLPGIWTKKHPLPTERSEVYAAAANGKLYVIGGQNNQRTDLYVNDEYDPATDNWRERAGMPHGMKLGDGLARRQDLYGRRLRLPDPYRRA